MESWDTIHTAFSFYDSLRFRSGMYKYNNDIKESMERKKKEICDLGSLGRAHREGSNEGVEGRKKNIHSKIPLFVNGILFINSFHIRY